MAETEIEYQAWSNTVIKDIRKYMPRLGVNTGIQKSGSKGNINNHKDLGLGRLCRNKHEFENTDRSLRCDNGRGKCVECRKVACGKYLKRKRQEKNRLHVAEGKVIEND